MEELERSCLASRNIGDRFATLRSKRNKVGDIIVCIGFKGVCTLKELLDSFNYFDTVLPPHSDIKHVDIMQSVLVSLFIADKSALTI